MKGGEGVGLEEHTNTPTHTRERREKLWPRHATQVERRKTRREEVGHLKVCVCVSGWVCVCVCGCVEFWCVGACALE